MNGRQIADALGVSESTVSRLRDGERRPSLALMGRIRDAAKWPLQDQFVALDDGSFGSQLVDKMAASGPDQQERKPGMNSPDTPRDDQPALESFEVPGKISDRIRQEADLRALAERGSYGDRATESNDRYINP